MKRSPLAIPLIIEDHPEQYNGYPFITLLQHNKNDYLTIIDNSNNNNISCFVLDFCTIENINEIEIIDIANNWFHNSKHKYPVSIEFSKQNLTNYTSKIFRTYNTEFITRIIGPLPHFKMTGATKIKRRKRKQIPNNVEIYIENNYIDLTQSI